VFLITASIFCVSLLSLDYYLATNNNGMAFLLTNTNNAKQEEIATTTSLIKDNDDEVFKKMPQKIMDPWLGNLPARFKVLFG
jgi:uncharacterized protein YehS (DUF1456 family)